MFLCFFDSVYFLVDNDAVYIILRGAPFPI